MTVLKKYNTETTQWETIVVGKQGPEGPIGEPGVEIDDTPPENTSILWIDTDDTGDMVIPSGGLTGDVLVKTSNDDYDSQWLSTTVLVTDPAFTETFAPFTPTVGTSLGTSGTVNLDMAALNGTYQSITLTGDITFTASNRAAGRTVTLRLIEPGTASRSLTVPAGWVFVGSQPPVSLSGDVAILSVTFFGTADTDGAAAIATDTALASQFTPLRITLNTQSASYTLVAADEQKLVRMDVSTANTLTVPPVSSVTWAVGAQVHVVQSGVGQTTVTAGSGVTINGTPGLKTRARYSALTLIYEGSDVWLALGDLAA
jgi:hypothetical protein